MRKVLLVMCGETVRQCGVMLCPVHTPHSLISRWWFSSGGGTAGVLTGLHICHPALHCSLIALTVLSLAGSSY